MLYTVHRRLYKHGAFADDKKECGHNRIILTTAAKESILEEMRKKPHNMCTNGVTKNSYSQGCRAMTF